MSKFRGTMDIVLVFLPIFEASLIQINSLKFNRYLLNVCYIRDSDDRDIRYE